MSDSPSRSISWVDLTVENAEEVREFYEQVAGWTSAPVSMGDYSDFNMMSGDQPIAGICHARGENANQPPMWMIYITVDDLDQSIADCERLGGEVVSPTRSAGGGRFAVVRDPSGACAALYQSG